MITVCTSCGLKMQANLERIEREKGSDFSLWEPLPAGVSDAPALSNFRRCRGTRLFAFP